MNDATTLSDVELVNSFLTGTNEGNNEVVSFKDGDFFYKGNQFAKRASDGEVLLATGLAASDEVNDAFIRSLAKNDTKFSRIGNFNSLLNATNHIDSLRNGKHDQLKIVGKLYGFEFSEDELSLYKQKTELESKINSVEERVNEFFKGKQREIAEKAKAAELAAMDAKKRDIIERWEAGVNLSNSDRQLVEGSGGGTRLKVVENSRGRADVVGSTGQRTTLNQIREAFNFVTPHMFGGKEITNRYALNNYQNNYNAEVGRTRSYTICIQKMRNGKEFAHMGCQTVTKQELERFAISQGWPVDGSLVTA